jgi:hypothetical protein
MHMLSVLQSRNLSDCGSQMRGRPEIAYAATYVSVPSVRGNVYNKMPGWYEDVVPIPHFRSPVQTR